MAGALARLSDDGWSPSVTRRIVWPVSEDKLTRSRDEGRFPQHDGAPQTGRGAISRGRPGSGKSPGQSMGIPGLDVRAVGQVGASRVVRGRCLGLAQPRGWTRRGGRAQVPPLIVALSTDLHGIN